jgi:hypothetical protein
MMDIRCVAAVLLLGALMLAKAWADLDRRERRRAEDQHIDAILRAAYGKEGGCPDWMNPNSTNPWPAHLRSSKGREGRR